MKMRGYSPPEKSGCHWQPEWVRRIETSHPGASRHPSGGGDFQKSQTIFSLLLSTALFLTLGSLSPEVCSAAERVHFKNGRTLSIESHEMTETTAFLFLDKNNRMEIDKDWIEGFSQEETLPEPGREASSTAESQTRHYSAEDLLLLVRESAQKFRVDEKLLTSMIRAESDFNPMAVSPKGARGLMQLMPETASALKVKDVFDPRQNLEAGAQYMRNLLQQFNDNLVLALAAYNAGPSAVLAYSGIPPFPETQQYVRKVLSLHGRLN
jgi:hypothetical protein